MKTTMLLERFRRDATSMYTIKSPVVSLFLFVRAFLHSPSLALSRQKSALREDRTEAPSSSVSLGTRRASTSRVLSVSRTPPSSSRSRCRCYYSSSSSSSSTFSRAPLPRRRRRFSTRRPRSREFDARRKRLGSHGHGYGPTTIHSGLEHPPPYQPYRM